MFMDLIHNGTKLSYDMREAPKDDMLECMYTYKIQRFGTIEDHFCSAQPRYSTQE